MKNFTKKNKKKAILTMGLPAAGKSTILKTKYKEEKQDSVNVDPDEIKENHPDYDPKNPQELHQWSKEVANKKRWRAMAEGKNLIIDGTGTNLEKMTKWIYDLQALDYEVTLVYVKVTLKTSLHRNAKRDRNVPEHVIREKAEYVTTSFQALKKIVDKVEVHDNN